MSRKKTNADINMDAASEVLGNVLDACQLEPNTIPLETLASYSNYRRERYLAQKIILLLILIVFLILPVFLIPADFTMELTQNTATGDGCYCQINVNGILPVKKVSASINGHGIEVYEMEDHIYSCEPGENGILQVSVTLVNHQYNMQNIEVDTFDDDDPYVVSDEISNHTVIITFADDGLGIDFAGIKAVDYNGNTILPVSYNESTGAVTWNYPNASLNIFVPDLAGNTLQLLLTVQ